MLCQTAVMARPRLIDRSAVLDAALAVADEVGIDNLTMSAVGRRLGVSAMALYRHVGDKSELLDGLVERLLSDAPIPDPSLEPRHQLTVYADGVRRTARRHPAVFPLLLTRPARTDGARHHRDAVVRLLEALGVPASRSARVERLITTMILGYAASEAAGRFDAHSSRVRDADWAALGDVVDATIAAYVTH